MDAGACPALPCSEAAQGPGYLLSRAKSRSQASWQYWHCWIPRPSLERFRKAWTPSEDYEGVSRCRPVEDGPCPLQWSDLHEIFSRLSSKSQVLQDREVESGCAVFECLCGDDNQVLALERNARSVQHPRAGEARIACAVSPAQIRLSSFNEIR
jgi:hypothetical protein